MPNVIRLLVVSVVVLAGCSREQARPPDVMAQVKDAITKKDFPGADRILEGYRASYGVTPPVIEALSVLAQGEFAAKSLDTAGTHAGAAYELARTFLQNKQVNAEVQTATALGRAIEILAQVSVERGARSEAVGFLERELATYKGTSVEKRIQKNINLLSLEGTAAPPLDLSEFLDGAHPPLSSLKGRVVVMFFWAHWCSDCKAQGPILAKLVEKYEKQGLTIVAPTQRFGYVANDEKAAPAVENPYIDSVRKTYYPVLAGRPIPLSEANHRRYGVSSTPTLVIVDRRGIIRLYHPGRMTEAELDPILRRLIDERA